MHSARGRAVSVRAEVRTALHPGRVLQQTALLVVERGGTTLSRKLNLLSDTFADRLTATRAAPIDLLRGAASQKCPPPAGHSKTIRICGQRSQSPVPTCVTHWQRRNARQHVLPWPTGERAKQSSCYTLAADARSELYQK